MIENQPTGETASAASTHVAVVGAGPIGLEMAVALRRRGIEFEIFDAGSLGQTMTWWAPQTRWFSSNERISIAGIPLQTTDQTKATREQYLNYLRAIAIQYDIRPRSNEPVVNVTRDAEDLTVFSRGRDGPKQTRCRAVVLAIGGTDFPNRLNIPGEELPHVDGYFREPHCYFGRRVLIIGGRNSAVEAALRLHHVGADVVISYRGSDLPCESIKYWLLPEIRALCESGRIESYWHTQPIRISAQTVTLESLEDARQFEVAADDVLALIGYQQDKRLFRSIGIELRGEQLRPVFDPETMQTNIPGIYVAGTAVGGTQSSRYQIFLENCHSHIDRILTHLIGQQPTKSVPKFRQQAIAHPES